jgi:tetratricopeptide (TPR) repeat protein
MSTGYPSDGEASADDYYLDEQGWQYYTVNQEDRDIYGWISGTGRSGADPQWVHPYKTIFYSNLVLEGVEKLRNGADKQTLDQLRGAALFFRAYALWNVAQLYAKPYSAATANADLGVPVRLTSDVNEVSARGNLQQSYDRITQDLNEAVILLSNSSKIQTRPNKVAAYAMLARVYLSMENYALAQTNANLALQLNSQLMDFNTLDPFAWPSPFERFNKEVIFHSLTTAGHTIDPGFGSVAYISEEIVNAYEPNDLRKEYYLDDRGDGVYYFGGSYDAGYDGQLFNGLTVDEMYLIRSECYARANNITEAMRDLNTLLRTRWATGTYVDKTTSSSTEALQIILTERRKELLMRGQRWTDLRRLNKDDRFRKNLSKSIIVGGQTLNFSLPANDPRYTLLIPQQVIINSGIQQNSR